MANQEKFISNTIIIGGGVAGLSAAIYLARAGLNPLVFAGSPPGGQLMLTSEVENFPGHTSILGSELVANIRRQAEKFGAKLLDDNIKSIANAASQLKTVITVGEEKEYKTKTIVIATGAKAVWLGLESEKKLRGKGVSACATCDGFFFRNKTVAVIGGGDSALEEALTLTKFAQKVYLIHRRDSFKASKIMQKRVFENNKIEVIFNDTVEEVLGTAKVEGLRLKSGKNLVLSGVFVAIGHKPDTDFVKDIVAVDSHGYIITTQRFGMELTKLKSEAENLNFKKENFDFHYPSMTSTSGIFAAGDCVDIYYRQASYASGMGVGAALDVERYLESLT